MKIILTTILLYIFSCNRNLERKQKRKEAISKILFLPIFLPRPSSTYPSPVQCGITGSFLQSNLKSIEIYHNSIKFFSNPINSATIYSPNFCDRLYYTIRFEENSKLISIHVYYKKKDGQNQNGNEYTSVGLTFKDNTFKDYTMNFNGDPDTFTEFTAGEYRFVAVR